MGQGSSILSFFTSKSISSASSSSSSLDKKGNKNQSKKKKKKQRKKGKKRVSDSGAAAAQSKQGVQCLSLGIRHMTSARGKIPHNREVIPLHKCDNQKEGGRSSALRPSNKCLTKAPTLTTVTVEIMQDQLERLFPCRYCRLLECCHGNIHWIRGWGSIRWFLKHTAQVVGCDVHF